MLPRLPASEILVCITYCMHTTGPSLQIECIDSIKSGLVGCEALIKEETAMPHSFCNLVITTIQAYIPNNYIIGMRDVWHLLHQRINYYFTAAKRK